MSFVVLAFVDYFNYAALEATAYTRIMQRYKRIQQVGFDASHVTVDWKALLLSYSIDRTNLSLWNGDL